MVWFAFLVLVRERDRQSHVITLVFPLLHIAVGVAIARNAVRDVRGRERLIFGDCALRLEQRGDC